MKPPRATLGGIPLTDAGHVGWSETIGVTPHQQVFTFHRSQEKKLDAIMGTAADLVIDSDTAPTLKWRGLYPLRKVPSNTPYHVSVLVADLRWRWPRLGIHRTYNLFRKTGVRRIVAGQVVELASFKDDYIYVAATLKDLKRKWTPREVVEDVLGRLSARYGFEWSVDKFPVGEGLGVESLDLSEGADSALARVLALVPGLEVKVTKDAKVVLFDATDLAASKAAIGSRAPTVAGQVDLDVNLRVVRPSKINVWFWREVELRFDAAEEGDDSSSTVQTGPNADRAMLMDNVLPLPDPSTLINGEQYGAGTWVTVSQALAAWNEELSTLGKSVQPPALTIANVRKHWFRLESLYTARGNFTQDGEKANWAARIATLRAHFRRTYRIRRPWMERIRHLRPYLLGIHDPVSGTRSVSRAWSQFTIAPTDKAYVQAYMKQDPNLQFQWLAVDNYPGFDEDLWTKGASPASVQVVDEQAGILHISYVQLNGEVASAIYPSLMADANGKAQLPTRDLADALQGVIAVNGKVKGAGETGLAADFRVAMLLTAIPLAPNDETRMFSIEVAPGDLPDSVRGRVQVAGGVGPPWDIFCPPGLLTAWYAHRNTVAARDEAYIHFGFDQAAVEAEAPPIPGGVGPPVPLGLNASNGYEIINLGDTSDLLRSMAHALATAQWAAFVDAREGARVVHLSPSLELAGNIDAVRHRLDPDGRLLTEASMGMARRPIDPMALVPRAARPWILGVPDSPA